MSSDNSNQYFPDEAADLANEALLKAIVKRVAAYNTEIVREIYNDAIRRLPRDTAFGDEPSKVKEAQERLVKTGSALIEELTPKPLGTPGAMR